MQRDVIATYELQGRNENGAVFPVQVLLCRPRESVQMAPAWASEFIVVPFMQESREIYGEGSFQSLCLAARSAVELLVAIVDQGGILEYSDGTTFDPEVFGFRLLSNRGDSGGA
jgi:hypothetical protein